MEWSDSGGLWRHSADSRLRGGGPDTATAVQCKSMANALLCRFLLFSSPVHLPIGCLYLYSSGIIIMYVQLNVQLNLVFLLTIVSVNKAQDTQIMVYIYIYI